MALSLSLTESRIDAREPGRHFRKALAELPDNIPYVLAPDTSGLEEGYRR